MDVEKIFIAMESELKAEIWGYTNCPSFVDDIYQEAYIKLNNYIKQGKRFYGNERSIRNMLKMMVKNLAIDQKRRDQRSKMAYTDKLYGMIDDTLPDQGLIDEDELPVEEAHKKTLKNALSNMNKDFYRTYKLRMKGHKFKEIARITDCSINTALGRMRYAVLKIKEEFDGKV